MSATDNNSAMNDEDLKAEIAALFEKSTLPATVDFSVDGRFDSAEQARGLGEEVVGFFRLFGAFLNLQGLEAVTIADDYNGEISRIEQGFKNAPALAPTEDGFGSGAAMAVPVLRKGMLKTRIVLHSNLLRVLGSDEEWARSIAIHTMAHEAGHAHDHEIESRNLPGAYGSYIPDYKEGRLFLLAHKCWTEYIASHLSSRWGTDDYCKGYSDMLCSMLSTARERGNAALDRYGSHKDILKVEREIIDAYGLLLDRASYLVGHVHGLEKTVEEMAPEFFKLVNETAWFRPTFERYEANVRALHESYGAWGGLDTFEPLKKTFESLLNTGGMFYYRLPFDEQWRIGLNKPGE